MNKLNLAKQLTIDEGNKKKPYKDTVGKITIGVGRNLDDVGLSDDEIQYLLDNDIERVIGDLNVALPWWSALSEERQQVLANMCFNLGIARLMAFKNTLQAVEEGRYEDAANGMLASLWAKQVGARALRLSQRMRKG